MDESTLEELLARTVAPEGPRPTVAGLRARVVRRRRRRVATAGALAALALVVVSTLVVAAPGQAPDRIVTTTPPTTTSTSTVGAAPGPPTLTVGALPEGMAASGCSLLLPADDLRVCTFSIPGTLVPTTISLSFVPGAATDAVREAWARGDAAAVSTLLAWGPGEAASFDDLGGTRLLVLGELERVEGDALGLPDRVARGYGALVGDTVVQVVSEAPGAQVRELLGALAIEPRWSALDGVEELLPEGTVVVAQGTRSRWADARGLSSDAPEPPPAPAFGADLVLPTSARRGLSVEVTEGIDALGFLQGLRTRAGAPYELGELDGRPSVRIDRAVAPAEGEGVDPSTGVIVAAGPQLVVAIDDDTLLSVAAASTREEGAIEPVARRVLANLG